MSLFPRLGLTALVLSTLGVGAAHATEQVFEGRYTTREGAARLAVAVDLSAPRGGASRAEVDGDGIRLVAEGATDQFELVLGAQDDRQALSFSTPRECRPSRDSDGCFFDLDVLDASGAATGVSARVMVASTSGTIDPELLADRVTMETRGYGTGLSADILVEARPEWNDLEVFIRFDFDDDWIDFDDWGDTDDGGDHEDSPPSPTVPDLDTYHVLTYNVAALPQTAFSDDDFGPDDDYAERGHSIAGMILANDYDVVVLNEVFEDTMRETLIADLEAEYPFIIKEAWDGDADTTHRQDSGLMLFSRFPGDPMDIGSECNESSNVDVKNLDDGGGTSICDAAFFPFTDLDGEDSWAEKGFFWAHLWNTRTNRPISILGTHTQASYYAVDTELFNDERDARATNFKEILAVVDTVTRWGEDLILMGDMNVVGDYTGKNSEYLEIFGPTGSIRDHGLGDEWRDTTSLDDPGFSWDGSDGPTGNMVANNDPFAQERLDYMLSREASAYDAKFEAPCFQHMQLRRDFEGPYGDLSDHYGLDAVIGWDSERCDPDRALVDATGGVNGEIGYRGAYQWYRFDAPGTYTLQVYSPDLDLDVTVYDATDLSTPLGYFEGDGSFVADNRETTSVIDAQGPFYLRVRAHEPTEIGNYTLTLDENAGSSWTDYLVLHPFDSVDGTYGQVLNGPNQDRVYYKFHQKELWSTALGNQEHQFQVAGCVNAQNCSTVKFSLWDDAHAWIYTSGPSNNINGNILESSASWLPNVDDRFYLTVDRTNENIQRDVSVTWWTDLREIAFGDLTCHIQEDYTGDDDIYADIWIDGTSAAAGLDDLWYGQLDTNGSNKHPLTPVGLDTLSITFKEDITMDVYEVDDDPDNDDWLGSDTLYSSGVSSFDPFVTSVMPDPDADAQCDPDAMKWHEDEAAYSLNWWLVE